MSLDEFDLVVVGQEPQGLWLLGEYARLSSALPQPLERVAPRLAWLSLGLEQRPVALPVPVARRFRCPVKDVWSPEIVTPRRCVDWNPVSLTKRFPELPASEFLYPSLESIGSPVVSALTYVLRRHPDLLCYAHAVWKAFGRTERLQPEALLWGSLLFAETTWWNGVEHLSPGTIQLELEKEAALEAVEMPSRGPVTMRFSNGRKLSSAKWVFNMRCTQMLRFARRAPKLLEILHQPLRPMISSRQIPLELVSEKLGVPSPVRPLTLILDTEEIPDPETEIRVLELSNQGDQKKLTLWNTDTSDLSLDYAVDVLKSGLQSLHATFPFLADNLVSIYPPLYLESCHGSETRERVMADLEQSALETYKTTSVHTDTRHPAMFQLFPFLRCQLPYPLGPLLSAERLLTELIGKKRIRQDREGRVNLDGTAPRG